MVPAVPARHAPVAGGDAPIGFADEPEFRSAVVRAASLVTAGVPHAIFVVHVARLASVRRHCGNEAELALVTKIRRLLAHRCEPWLAHCRTRIDQIAILKRDCRRRDAVAIAHGICDVLDRETFSWHGLSFRLGATVGLLELEDVPEGIGDWLARATDACAAARSLGNEGVLMLTGRLGEQAVVDRERAWREHINEMLV